MTLILILLEGLMLLLFPLFIGEAIDEAIHDQWGGTLALILLGIGLLIVGMGRRVFDSRFYGRLYQDLGLRTLGRIRKRETSVQTARLDMIKELMEFFENALPELINAMLGLLGIVMLLYTLNVKVFIGSLIVTGLIGLIYGLTSQRTLGYHEKANNEWERQAATLARNKENELRNHLREMVRWNIRLSDLEALNFSASWLVALAFLVGSIMLAIQAGITDYGQLLALVLYVFQYIEHVLNLPLFYQSGLRLKEILQRISTRENQP